MRSLVNEIWNIFENGVYSKVCNKGSHAGTDNRSFGSSKESHTSRIYRVRIGRTQGWKTERKSTWCFRCSCERRKGRNARKIDMEFPQFSPKGVAWRVGDHPAGLHINSAATESMAIKKNSRDSTMLRAVRRIFTEVSLLIVKATTVIQPALLLRLFAFFFF